MSTLHASRIFSALCVLSLVAPSQRGFGQNGDNAYVVEVREEWELTVGEPNLTRNAPQVTMTMSPYGDLNHDYFAFILNMKTAPDYSPGGMQVVQYHGNQVTDYRNGPQQGMLRTNSETVRWRQRLRAEEGRITFEIDHGSSATWGSFGGQGYLKATLSGGPDNLNAYRPHLSLGESGIGFAGNRVESLTLTRLEWHLSDGQVVVFTAPIDIDSDLDPWD